MIAEVRSALRVGIWKYGRISPRRHLEIVYYLRPPVAASLDGLVYCLPGCLVPLAILLHREDVSGSIVPRGDRSAGIHHVYI